MLWMVASSIPCKLPFRADRVQALAGGSHVSSGIDVACPTTQSVFAIASLHELHGDSWPSSSTGTSSFCCNQQYSITAVTTSTGSIAERYAYSAYGQPTILDASASVLSSSAINNRYTYTGREWDATLGLHHFRARWMSPSAGRFLRRDPIEYEGSEWGLYEFVKAGCLCFADPDGMEREIPCDAPALALARNACLRYGGINPAKPTKCYLRPGNLVVVKAFCNHTGDCYADQYRIIDEMKEAYCDAPRSCEKFNCPCDKNDCGLSAYPKT